MQNAGSGKVLLITDLPPSKRYTGSTLTWHLCKNFSAANLVGYFISNPDVKIEPEFPFSPAPKFHHVKRRSEYGYRPRYTPKIIKMFTSFGRELFRKYIEVPRYARDILKFAKMNETEKIWIILQGQTMTWLAEYLIKRKKMPVHVQVWETASWGARGSHIDRFSRAMLIRSYKYCIKNCDEFGSPSFNMSKMVKSLYGRESFPLIGISPVLAKTERELKPRQKIIIGIAGQVYGEEAFDALAEALDSIYWEIDGKPVEIHVWGDGPIRYARSRVISRGLISQEQLVEELALCDILYCTYWFETKRAEEAQTSFPTKVVSYLASGTPVFYHGPGNSSPGLFLRDKKAAVCCYSLDTQTILYYLRKTLFAPEVAEILKNADHVMQNDLGEKTIFRNFRNFLKLESGGRF